MPDLPTGTRVLSRYLFTYSSAHVYSSRYSLTLAYWYRLLQYDCNNIDILTLLEYVHVPEKYMCPVSVSTYVHVYTPVHSHSSVHVSCIRTRILALVG